MKTATTVPILRSQGPKGKDGAAGGPAMASLTEGARGLQDVMRKTGFRQADRGCLNVRKVRILPRCVAPLRYPGIEKAHREVFKALTMSWSS